MNRACCVLLDHSCAMRHETKTKTREWKLSELRSTTTLLEDRATELALHRLHAIEQGAVPVAQLLEP